MKLVLFNNFVPGVMKGDRVVDVSSVVSDIPRINAQTLMSGLIGSFSQYRSALERAVAISRRHDGDGDGERKARRGSSGIRCCHGDNRLTAGEGRQHQG